MLGLIKLKLGELKINSNKLDTLKIN